MLRATQLTEELAFAVGELAMEESGEAEAEASSSDEEVIFSAINLKTVERAASYVVVVSPGGIFRLHRAGSYGCWMGRKRDFRDATEFDAKPPTSRYTHVCKPCWPPKADDEDSESGEASPGHMGDGEEPWYDAMWGWGGSGFDPRGWGSRA